ncbi:hypothetical protein L484_000027 [Morus notabilis]|uniref:Uncharacterized protein n=1 Tax=Morus notabilis TaxID=981085 RepID=W9T1B2_9ROSA|nr:hypothetical protein L484_000027 [Morus notabilis]
MKDYYRNVHICSKTIKSQRQTNLIKVTNRKTNRGGAWLAGGLKLARKNGRWNPGEGVSRRGSHEGGSTAGGEGRISLMMISI